jgi:Cft2 family RNA processing exonuclease
MRGTTCCSAATRPPARRGGQIQQHGPKGGWVELDGQRIDIRAGIHTLGGFSAHADQKDLLNFIGRMHTQARPGAPGARR